MVKRHVILHIGTMKTGTTSIQQVFAKRRDDILAQGACYPRSPGAQAHELLTYAAAAGQRGPKAGDTFWKGVEPQVRLRQFRTEFDAELRAVPDHVGRVILSDERFSFYLRSREHIAALKAILDPYFDTFTVIAYLRRQDSFLASRYAEQLRVGTVGEPDHRHKNPDRLQDYDYRWLLANWASVFGQEAMKPRIYERVTKGGFDSVKDFLVACGLDLTVSDDDRGARSNPSMNLSGQHVLREVGRQLQEQTEKAGLGGPLWRRISDSVTMALPGKGWLPTRDEAASFMERFSEGNEEVRARYFPDRSSLFADESAGFPEQPAEMSDRALFEAACRSLLEVAARAQKREGVITRTAAKAVAAAGRKPAAGKVVSGE